MNSLKVKTRKHLLQSPIILDLLEPSLKFIKIVEDEKLLGEEFLKKSHQELSNLYTKALRFMEMRFAEPTEHVHLDEHLIWPEGKPDVLGKIGSEKYCKKLLDPFLVSHFDRTVISFADELNDNYCHLKTSISLLSLDNENAIASGLFYLQNHFVQ